MKFSFNNKIFELLARIGLDVFWISIVSITGLVLLERYKAGFVSYYLNINGIFVFALLSGLFAILFFSKEKQADKLAWYHWIFMYAYGLLLSAVIYLQTRELQGYGILFTLVFLFGYLIFIQFDTVKETNEQSYE